MEQWWGTKFTSQGENWFDEDGPAISVDEWSKLVVSDSEMRMEGFAEATTSDGSKLRVESDGLAVWVAYSGRDDDGNLAWFSFNGGNIVVKNPDTEILKKMWQIAQRLSAQVQGDEGELYDENGDPQ